MKPLVLLILGTARDNNESVKVFNYVKEKLAGRDDLELKAVECKEYIHGKTIAPQDNNPIINPWRDLVAKAVAFIIIAPEYNHGYPGELKLLLDQEYEAYKGKPVLVGGVSSGVWGGTRLIENLVPVLKAFGMKLLKDDLHFPKVKESFTELNSEANKLYEPMIKKAVDELLLEI